MVLSTGGGKNIIMVATRPPWTRFRNSGGFVWHVGESEHTIQVPTYGTVPY